MKKLTLLFVTLLCLGFMFQACDDTKTYAEQLEDEDNAIKDFISKNNIKVLSLADFEAKGNTTDLKTNEYVALSGGVYMQIVYKGTGDSIKIGDRVQIYYRTWLIDSTLIDYNVTPQGHYYDPLEFDVTPPNGSSVVEGLNEGIKFMQQGTVAGLIVPSQIGYGQSGYQLVPAFSTLLFEIRVHKVIKGAGN